MIKLKPAIIRSIIGAITWYFSLNSFSINALRGLCDVIIPKNKIIRVDLETYSPSFNMQLCFTRNSIWFAIDCGGYERYRDQSRMINSELLEIFNKYKNEDIVR